MTFQSFLTTYNGQKNVGNTTENKGECVGLSSVWIEELGLPHVWGHAMDLFKNADEKFFEKILNTPDAIPQAGDIVIWGKAFNGTFGHTGIATGTGDLITFECFEQNDPLGSSCHLKKYKYDFVTGWLRPVQLDNQQTEITKLREERDRNWNWFTQVCDALGVGTNVEAAVAEAKKLIGLDDILVQKDKKIQELQANISTVESELAGKTAMLTSFSDKNKELEQHIVQLTEAVEESQKKIDSALLDNKSLADTVQELKNALHEPLEGAIATIWRGIRKLFHLGG